MRMKQLHAHPIGMAFIVMPMIEMMIYVFVQHHVFWQPKKKTESETNEHK